MQRMRVKTDRIQYSLLKSSTFSLQPQMLKVEVTKTSDATEIQKTRKVILFIPREKLLNNLAKVDSAISIEQYLQ